MSDKQLSHIPISQIYPPTMLLRAVKRTTYQWEEFCDSIKRDGVLQPILVRPHPTLVGYQVVEGNHRYHAAKLAGHSTIPCYIREVTDKEIEILQLKAQAVRPINADMWDYAKRLRKLMDSGHTINDLCSIICKSPQWVRKILKLNRLCDAARLPLSNGEIKLCAAVALSDLPEPLQARFVEDAMVMPAGKFVDRVREARLDYELAILNGTVEDRDEGIKPRLRSLKQLMIESDTKEAANRVLEARNAETALDGWMACLAWMMRLDPVTIQSIRDGVKEEKDARLTDLEFRRQKRRMIENLVPNISPTGVPYE